MLELLISLLFAVLPTCPVEDSGMCVWENDGHVYVNGPMQDPAPITYTIR